MSEQFRIGPCRVLVADSIDLTFASWLDLGNTRGDIVVNQSPDKIALGRTDQAGSTPLANAVFLQGHSATATIPIINEHFDTLLKVMPHAFLNTENALEALGFGSKQQYVQAVAVALIPEFAWDETDVRELWKSKYAMWFRKAFFRFSDQFLMALPEGDDALADQAIGLELMQVADGSPQNGGIGSVFILPTPIPIMGVDNPAQRSVAVPDAQLQTALDGAGLNTVQDMANSVANFANGAGTSGAPNTIADATGIEWLVKTPQIDLQWNAITTIPSLKDFKQLTLLDLSDNNISQADLSALVNELWLIRADLGGNSCVINIDGNNGVDATADAQINGTAGTKYAGDGLINAGCTVTY